MDLDKLLTCTEPIVLHFRYPHQSKGGATVIYHPVRTLFSAALCSTKDMFSRKKGVLIAGYRMAALIKYLETGAGHSPKYSTTLCPPIATFSDLVKYSLAWVKSQRGTHPLKDARKLEELVWMPNHLAGT